MMTPKLSSPSVVIIFTQTYPYTDAGEQTFIEPEIEHLWAAFDRVVIVPAGLGGKQLPIPPGIEIEEGYACRNITRIDKLHLLFLSIFSSSFYKEIISHPHLLSRSQALINLIRFVGHAERAKIWVADFINRKRINLNRTLFYTYWLDHITHGIFLARKQFHSIKLISRAHGYDLFEERHDPPYFPCRYQTLKGLDKLFLVSEAGKEYITRRYPWFTSSCEVARLGVRNPGFLASPSSDGIFRIASCSSIVAIKRLDLLAKGVERAASIRSAQKFEWHHFGDGPLKMQIEDLTRQIMPRNINCHFWGQLPNDQVLSFYKNYPVDIFVNTSASEGGCPVAIQEAISCGIPVIASGVGGNPEIVSDRNGSLLQINPTPDEIAEAIINILDEPGLAAKKRAASRAIWQDKFNADMNFPAFVNRILQLVDC